jgi:hypothetical protein
LLILWKERVLEKPESLKAERLCGAFQQSTAPEMHQTGLLQSAQRATGLCAGLQLAADPGDRSPRTTYFGSFALMDHPWQARKHQMGEKKTGFAEYRCFGLPADVVTIRSG